MSNEKVKTHKDLDVWKKSIDLAEDIYSLTAGFPRDEQYGLVAQIRRSAVSVPSNIAEGAARGTRKEFIQYLYISMGSLSEVETQLLIAHKLKFLNKISILDEIEIIRKMLLGLIKFLKNNDS